MKKIIRYEKIKRCTCTLYMTEACNLNCVYCYEHKKGTAIMPMNIAQEGIRSTFERAIRDNIEYVEILLRRRDFKISGRRIRRLSGF